MTRPPKVPNLGAANRRTSALPAPPNHPRTAPMPTTTFPHTQHPDSDDEATSPPAPPALNSCTDVSSLLQRLAYLNKAETTITTRLDHLLSTQSSLTHTLSRLDLIRAHLGSQVVSARTLAHSTLSTAAQTATRISTSVHRLDTEQSRVRATLAVVEQVAELKACVLGVTDSMGAPQDWETAASYLHRASKIPPDIINGAFAESMVPSAEVPDMPSTTLENAAESLCALFLREFEKAAKEADGEKVTRFFKLFPLIGRAQTGLEVYGKYVCGGVSAKARRELDQPDRGDFFYSTAMTRLFEHIATIVEQHGGLVERHYGEGKMVKVVERLQVEADTQGGIIVDMFGEDKRIERKVCSFSPHALRIADSSQAHRSQILRVFIPGAILHGRPSGDTAHQLPCPRHYRATRRRRHRRKRDRPPPH